MIDENGVYICDYCQNEKLYSQYYTETGNHAVCTELEELRTQFIHLQKIKQAVAELDKCDKAYVQALSVDASITKQIDDYDNAIENVLKVYRGEE